MAGILSAPLAAAPTRTLPAPVGTFAELWKRTTTKPRDAAADFAKFARQHPWAADLAAYGRGRALLAFEPTTGMNVLDSLAHAQENGEVGRRARILFIRSWFERGTVLDTADLPLLDRFLATRLPEDQRRQVQMRRLRLQILRRDTAAVVAAAVVIAAEGAPAATLDDLAQLLAAFDSTLGRRDPLRHAFAGARFAADQPDSSRVLFDSLAAAGYTFSANDRVTMGRILLDLGRVNEAIANFRLGAEDPRDENALLWLGRGLERVGRVDDAQVVFLEYAKRWPASAKGQEILWTRGMDAEKAGNCTEASDWFERVRLSEGKRSDWARFRIGYCWYRQKDWTKARALLDRERLQAKGTMRDAAWFFAAMAARAQGDSAISDSLLKDLARISPWSFHGHLARRRVGLEQRLMDSLALQPDSIAGRPVPVAWALDTPPSLKASDTIAFVRALMARATGEDALWKAELDALDRAVKGAGARELGLILWMRSLGQEDLAMPRLRRLLVRMTPEEMARAPRVLLKLFYPMHFLADIKPHLRGDSIIDAAFVHAVMRQESAFDPWARSHAGAIGLLQLIPPTAKAMASKVGLKGFTPAQLTNPSVNIRLGVAYLRDLERIWGGQPALVLANYNAGPAPTLRWREAFRTLPLEEAAEEVTYWETRDYVKKCLANWWTYRMVYPEMR